MKISIVEQVVAPPPKRVILDLSEEEAGLLEAMCSSYCVSSVAADDAYLAAQRLCQNLSEFYNKQVYPYINYFLQE